MALLGGTTKNLANFNINMGLGQLKKNLSRKWRRWSSPAYLKDKKKAGYWLNRVLGNEEIQVVQIGSNDGKTGDPLNPLFVKNHKWKGLFVEPIPYFFQKLKRNYSDSNRYKCIQTAIGHAEKLTFYFVDPQIKHDHPHLPYWIDQLGSFDKSHIQNHLSDAYMSYIHHMEVDCITVAELLKQNNLHSIDLLHIDAEGYDWKILSQLDLKKYLPTCILIEYHHLSAQDRQALYNFLTTQYNIYDLGIDYFAILKVVENDLLSNIDAYLTPVTQ